MRKRDAVFDYAWVFPFTCENLFEKPFCIVDLSTLREHLNNLAERIRQLERFIGLSGKASYPVDCRAGASPAAL